MVINYIVPISIVMWIVCAITLVAKGDGKIVWVVTLCALVAAGVGGLVMTGYLLAKVFKESKQH